VPSLYCCALLQASANTAGPGVCLLSADVCYAPAAVAVLAGGEGSGPLYPPRDITEDCFSAGEAAAAAYARAGLGPADIDYWGLYDCFPICLIRCACIMHDAAGLVHVVQRAVCSCIDKHSVLVSAAQRI
jgi:hypothetical protein